MSDVRDTVPEEDSGVARIPQWAIGVFISIVSVGGSALATVAVTENAAATNASRITALEARVETLQNRDADRAREQAVLAERLDSIQQLLVEVRSDVRQLTRVSEEPRRR